MMLPMLEPMLYIDPQKEKPAFLCPECGGECYYPGCHCLRCERRQS